MREKSYAPGPTYYLMMVPLLAGVINASGQALGYWGIDPENPAFFFLVGFFCLVMLILLVLSWRRFLPRSDGLAVADLRGRRLHRWETLGKPTTKEFLDGSKDSMLLRMEGWKGQTDPQAFSHYIRDGHGRTLYRVGPWYAQRRELMREIRRCLRESG